MIYNIVVKGETMTPEEENRLVQHLLDPSIDEGFKATVNESLSEFANVCLRVRNQQINQITTGASPSIPHHIIPPLANHLAFQDQSKLAQIKTILQQKYPTVYNMLNTLMLKFINKDMAKANELDQLRSLVDQAKNDPSLFSEKLKSIQSQDTFKQLQNKYPTDVNEILKNATDAVEKSTSMYSKPN